MTVSKSKIYSSIKWNSVTIFFNIAAVFIQMYILFRLLSKEDFGIMASISAVYFYLRAICTFKIGEVIMHTTDIRNDRKTLSSTLWLLLLVSLFFYLCLFFLGPYYSELFTNSEIYSGLLLIGILPFFDVIYEVYKSLLHKEMEFKNLFKISFIGNLSYIFVSILLAMKGYGYRALLYSFALSIIIQSVLSFLYGLKLFTPLFHFNKQEVVPTLRFGGFSSGSKLLRDLRNQIDVILIGKFFGLEILGVYNIFKSLFMRVVKIISPLIGNVTTPILSIEKDNIDLSRNIFYRQNKIYTLITIPMFAGVFVFAESILELYFGETYIEHMVLFQLLTVAFLLSNVTAMVNTLIVSHGKVKSAFHWNLLSLLVYLVVVILFFKSGIEAFAIALICFYVFKIFSVFSMIIKRSIGGNYREYIDSYIGELLISIGVGTVFYLINHFTNYSIGGRLVLMIIYALLVAGILRYRSKDELLQIIKKR